MLLAEMERHAPEVLAALRPAVSGRSEDLDFIRLEPEAFARVPGISLDYAVAERTDRAAVVPADLGWSDVGSWGALWDIGAKDESGNVAVGDVLLEGARDCYVRSDGMLTAVLGLQDAVLVVTEDAVLAMHRDRAQDVKRVVDRLRAAGRREAVAHNRVYRPWGFYESLIEGERFQVKRIVVTPGQRLSAAEAFPPRRALGGGERHRAGDLRWDDQAGPRERERLSAARLRAPAGEPGADSADADRSAERGVSRRGRYRALRGYVRTTVANVGGGRAAASSNLPIPTGLRHAGTE